MIFYKKYIDYELQLFTDYKYISAILINISIMIIFWGRTTLKDINDHKIKLIFKIAYCFVFVCFMFNVMIIFCLTMSSTLLNKIAENEAISNMSEIIMNKDHLRVHKEFRLYIKIVKFMFNTSLISLLIAVCIIIISKIDVFSDTITSSIIFISLCIAVVLIIYIINLHSYYFRTLTDIDKQDIKKFSEVSNSRPRHNLS